MLEGSQPGPPAHFAYNFLHRNPYRKPLLLRIVRMFVSIFQFLRLFLYSMSVFKIPWVECFIARLRFHDRLLTTQHAPHGQAIPALQVT